MAVSPDKSMVFFTSNLFGASYVFGVEVKKAENPAAADGKDTAELGRQWKPLAPEHGKHADSSEEGRSGLYAPAF
jgi:oligogalacturonide lyase